MQTSCYAHYKGPGRIVISRSFPRDLGPGYRIFKKLAPGAWFRQPEYMENEAKYRERYFREILAPLDPKEVYEHLHSLTAPHEPVLMCWEKDPSKPHDWCHRRMVAEWFKEMLGVDVPEYTAGKKPKSDKQRSLFADAE